MLPDPPRSSRLRRLSSISPPTAIYSISYWKPWIWSQINGIMFTVGNVHRYIGRRSGRHSIDTRSPLGRPSIDTRLRLGWYSVDSWLRCMSADIAFQVTDTSPILDWYLTDTWPTLGRYLTDTWPILDTIGTKGKIVMPLVHIALRFTS